MFNQPERIQGAQYSVKSDVWSLGITLVELALGRFPFSNDDEEDDSDFDEDDYREEELTLSPVKPLGREKTLAELDARRREKAARIAAEKKKEKKDNGSGQEKKKKGGVSLGGSGSQMSILELLQHVVNEPAPRLKPEGKFKKEAEEFVDACLEKDVNRRPTPKELLVSLELVCVMVHGQRGCVKLNLFWDYRNTNGSLKRRRRRSTWKDGQRRYPSPSARR